MAISTAIAIYFLIWWIVLFAVLPWGVRAQGEEGAPGTDPGAPRVPTAQSQADLDHFGRHRRVGRLRGCLRQGLGHARRAGRAVGFPHNRRAER